MGTTSSTYLMFLLQRLPTLELQYSTSTQKQDTRTSWRYVDRPQRRLKLWYYSSKSSNCIINQAIASTFPNLEELYSFGLALQKLFFFQQDHMKTFLLSSRVNMLIIKF